MSLAKPAAIALNSIALIACLYSLLIQTYVVGLLLAVGFGFAIGAVIVRQAAWAVAIAVLFCLLVGVVSTVAAFELWASGGWYRTASERLLFFAALIVFGAIGPLLNVYVLYGIYARPETAEPP